MTDGPGAARAYWSTEPGAGELRDETLRAPRPGEARVRALHSGISRGTELLVRRGDVPISQRERMRAPFQEGDFPFPVKYGYLSVGVVEDGPADLMGRRVFCLHPHQDRFVVAASMLTPLPDAVPSRRAVLTGTVETALNALWDAPPCAGDRIAVVGGGLVGGAVALLLRRFPLARLQIVDPDAARRRQLAEAGLDAVAPEDAVGDCDIVFHASASESGLALALGLLGDEAELVEMSWFGAREPRVPLGEDFHSRRLRITASQVSRIGAARRARRDSADRLATALELLADPAFDTLLAADIAFDEIDDAFAALEDGRIGPGCVVVTYPGAP
ncbi:dehydrogenase [Microbacterium chocolatum]|uniref:zinc-dependent alcohol dehydrogenase n=1 Tax=Microbacterium aurantiacum TaxID=162393 RepID=UPI00338EBD00